MSVCACMCGVCVRVCVYMFECVRVCIYMRQSVSMCVCVQSGYHNVMKDCGDFFLLL